MFSLYVRVFAQPYEPSCMERRTLLKTAFSAAAAVGAGGCLHQQEEPNPAREPGVAWHHEAAGRVDYADEERVYGRERWDQEEVDGGVYGLDADGGDGWTFGESGGYSSYTSVEVGEGAFDRGVYFGYHDDAIGSGSGELYAVEVDGSLRWSRDVGSVYDSPILYDDGVFAGGDRGIAYCFDVDGDERWSYEPPGEGTPYGVSVEAVDSDEAYVSAGDGAAAVDVDTGEELWSLRSDDGVSSLHARDGVAYVTRRGGLAAYADGDLTWSHRVEGTNSWIHEVDDSRLYFRHSFDLRALDLDDGDEIWRHEVGDSYTTEVTDDGVYVAADDLTLVSLEGEELWSVGFDDEVVAVEAAEEGVYLATETAVARVVDGEVAEQVSVEDAGGLAVADGGRVYVGGDGGVFAVDLGLN